MVLTPIFSSADGFHGGVGVRFCGGSQGFVGVGGGGSSGAVGCGLWRQLNPDLRLVFSCFRFGRCHFFQFIVLGASITC